MDFGLLLAILVPLLAIQVVLIVVAVRDLLRPERQVRSGKKGLWAIVIAFGEILGPLFYFTLGRENE